MADAWAVQMTDEQFVAALEVCTLPNEAFRHRDHLRLAWLYLRCAPSDVAAARMEQSIRRFASHHGAPQKYHHTMTLVWMRLVAAARTENPVDDFTALLDAHPDLLDKTTLRRFYSAERLESQAARTGWLDPDVSPLPESRT